MEIPLFSLAAELSATRIHTSKTRFKAIEKGKVYNYMRRRLEGANLQSYGYLRAIESNLCGRQWGREMRRHALDLVRRAIGREHQNGKFRHALGLVHRAIGLPKIGHTPLERDLRPLILSLSLMGSALFEMVTHGFICVAHSMG